MYFWFSNFMFLKFKWFNKLQYFDFYVLYIKGNKTIQLNRKLVYGLIFKINTYKYQKYLIS